MLKYNYGGTMSFYQKGDEVRITTDDYKKDNVREGDVGQYLEPYDSGDLSQALAKITIGDRLVFIPEACIEHSNDEVQELRMEAVEEMARQFAMEKGLAPIYTQKEIETVARPKRYSNGNIEIWDAIDELGLDYMQGNVLKYTARYRDKNGSEDLFKALNYLLKMISRETELDFYELREISIDELSIICSKRMR
jgi:hypothetical protein